MTAYNCSQPLSTRPAYDRYADRAYGGDAVCVCVSSNEWPVSSISDRQTDLPSCLYSSSVRFGSVYGGGGETRKTTCCFCGSVCDWPPVLSVTDKVQPYDKFVMGTCCVCGRRLVVFVVLACKDRHVFVYHAVTMQPTPRH